MGTENLKIGARGWRHPRWAGAYYPDDLPEDWQLSYYANDFNVVLVPAEYWDKTSGYDLELWSEDVSEDLHEDFYFYLECPPLESDAEIQCFKTQCSLIGDHLGGVIVPGGTDIESLELSCPIVKKPSLDDKKLSIGLLEPIDDMRAVRAWLEEFDKKAGDTRKVVFVSSRNNPDIPMETLMQFKTLSEMMGL